MQKGWSWAYGTVVQELSWHCISRDTPPSTLIALFRVVGVVARIGNEEAGGSETNVVPMLRSHLQLWLTDERSAQLPFRLSLGPANSVPQRPRSV